MTIDTRAKQIAQTIVEQLGGPTLKLMTGARDFVAVRGDVDDNECGVRFSLPSNFARGPRGCVNRVTIMLTTSDLYRVEFARVRRSSTAVTTGNITTTVLETFDGVYADQLVDVFEQHTGLVLRRPRVLHVRETSVETYPVTRADGRVVRVTVPPSDNY